MIIMSNIIYIVLTVGWTPTAYTIWTDTAHTMWISSTGPKAKADNVIIYAVVDASNDIQLKRACAHFCGQGIENGIDWNATYQTNTYFRNKNQYDKLNALETIQVAAAWPNARVNSIHPEVSPLCKLCGQTDTMLHSFWTCPCHANSLAPEITEG